MAGADGASPAYLNLLEDASSAPERYDFYQLLRRLEAARSDLPRLGRAGTPRDEPVRGGQPPSTEFAPATVTQFGLSGGHSVPRLNVAFFGLLGPQGPMPAHITELAHSRANHHADPAMARFFDLFNHRMLLFFYRAWADARAAVGRDRPNADDFARRLGTLSGRGGPEFSRRDAMNDDAKGYFTGHLAAQTRRPSALRATLRELLRLPIELLDFVPRWLELPPNGCGKLGRENGFSVLGRSAILGGRVFDVQSSIRIVAGPLSLEQYETLLPSGRRLETLAAITDNLLGIEIEWDVNLRLKASEIPALGLDGTCALGWTTWLPTSKERNEMDVGDLVLKRRLRHTQT